MKTGTSLFVVEVVVAAVVLFIVDDDDDDDDDESLSIVQPIPILSSSSYEDGLDMAILVIVGRIGSEN